jgi:hypothetical protein
MVGFTSRSAADEPGQVIFDGASMSKSKGTSSSRCRWSSAGRRHHAARCCSPVRSRTTSTGS